MPDGEHNGLSSPGGRHDSVCPRSVRARSAMRAKGGSTESSFVRAGDAPRSRSRGSGSLGRPLREQSFDLGPAVLPSELRESLRAARVGEEVCHSDRWVAVEAPEAEFGTKVRGRQKPWPPIPRLWRWCRPGTELDQRCVQLSYRHRIAPRPEHSHRAAEAVLSGGAHAEVRQQLPHRHGIGRPFRQALRRRWPGRKPRRGLI